jgi:hypothetical protein
MRRNINRHFEGVIQEMLRRYAATHKDVTPLAQ